MKAIHKTWDCASQPIFLQCILLCAKQCPVAKCRGFPLAIVTVCACHIKLAEHQIFKWERERKTTCLLDASLVILAIHTQFFMSSMAFTVLSFFILMFQALLLHLCSAKKSRACYVPNITAVMSLTFSCFDLLFEHNSLQPSMVCD